MAVRAMQYWFSSKKENTKNSNMIDIIVFTRKKKEIKLDG